MVPQPIIISQISPTLSGSLIFLHGLGDTGNGWAPVLKMVGRALPGLRLILPTALTRSVTLNGGLSMPAWYDIQTLDERDGMEADRRGTEESVEYVRKLVKEERERGAPLVFIGGFSQGGCIALAAGLSQPCDANDKTRVNGVISLSGYLASSIVKFGKDTQLPVFMAHGRDDWIVKFDYGERSFRSIKSAFPNTEFHSYSGLQHAANDQEISDMTLFLKTIMENDKKEL